MGRTPTIDIYLDVACVYNGFQVFLDFFCKCFNYFEHILQVLYLDVAKLDRVLLVLQWELPAPAAIVGRHQAGAYVQAREAEEPRAVPAWDRTTRTTFGRRRPHVGARKRSADVGIRTWPFV
jgi:hypothetical protein